MTRANTELGNVTPHNIKQLKKLNSVVFPVSYNDQFNKDVLEAGELAKLAYYNDMVVGAVCGRIDISEKSRRLYIMTLGYLYPYQRLGIATMLVQGILHYVEQDGNFASIPISYLSNSKLFGRIKGINLMQACLDGQQQIEEKVFLAKIQKLNLLDFNRFV